MLLKHIYIYIFRRFFSLHPSKDEVSCSNLRLDLSCYLLDRIGQEYMLQQRLSIIIIGLLASALAIGSSFVKSQAQSQIPNPSQSTAPLSPAERLDEWSENSPNEPIPAAIFFEQRVPDAKLVQLMRRYSVEPKAVYMSVAGMSGTHRVYKDKEAETVITEARQKTAQMMLNSRNSGKVRAKDFVERQPSEESLAQSPEEASSIDTNDARSLLENIEQNEAALAHAQGNQPLIYGAEVVGSIENIRKLAADPMVKGFEPGVKVNGRVIVPQSSLPQQIKTSQDMADRTQAIRALNAAEVRTRIEKIAREGVKGGNQ